MKLSKKLKRRIKQRMYASIACLTTILILYTSLNFNNVSVTLDKVFGKNEALTTSTRLPNTSTITYIYNTSDLIAFRNDVNSGENYSGRTVYLMSDIDMSSICSSSVGSWVPIGVGVNGGFAGTFDGNYHTISNLYINKSDCIDLGFFSILTGVVRNLKFDNVYIENTNNANINTQTGTISGSNHGTILNCGVNSGTLKATKTSINYNKNYPGPNLGGITAANTTGIVKNCYNRATIINKRSKCK